MPRFSSASCPTCLNDPSFCFDPAAAAAGKANATAMSATNVLSNADLRI
jgi:hypothetical protein